MTALIIDPFTQVLDALWDLFESHKGFTDLVRLKNRIKVSGRDRMPYKQEVQAADLPEVLIEPTEGGDLTYTSSAVQMVQNFAIRLATGDLRANKLLFPLKWEVIQALYKTRGELGLSFVKQVRVTDLAEAAIDEEANRGHAGWSASIGLAVDLYFSNTELQAG